MNKVAQNGEKSKGEFQNPSQREQELRQRFLESKQWNRGEEVTILYRSPLSFLKDGGGSMEFKKEVIRVRFTKSVKEKLDAVAEEEGRGISELVREAIMEWLHEKEKEMAKPFLIK